MAMAQDMAAAAAHSVMMTKRAINRTYDMMGMREALRMSLDIDILIESTMTDEKAEFKRIRSEEGLKAALAWRDRQVPQEIAPGPGSAVGAHLGPESEKGGTASWQSHLSSGVLRISRSALHPLRARTSHRPCGRSRGCSR